MSTKSEKIVLSVLIFVSVFFAIFTGPLFRKNLSWIEFTVLLILDVSLVLVVSLGVFWYFSKSKKNEFVSNLIMIYLSVTLTLIFEKPINDLLSIASFPINLLIFIGVELGLFIFIWVVVYFLYRIINFKRNCYRVINFRKKPWKRFLRIKCKCVDDD
jgi:predicted neutral ceramidase superfamily lipid hydrolase